MVSAKQLECYTLRFTILGFLCIQIIPIAGNPLVANNSSQAQLLRTIRSVAPVNMDYTRQNCPACNDESDTGRCSRKAYMRVKRVTEELQCKPEPTIVKLKLPGPEYSIEPPIARVMRCDGYCRDGYDSCLPVQTSFVKVPVILTNHRMGTTKCVEYEVEQHDECACE